MVGKARDHFGLRQAELEENDDGFAKLLNKVRDYAKRRKLDHVATKAVSSG